MITPTLKKVFVTGGSRLPSAYQEVEYLQSSGTQYIDTGVTSPNVASLNMTAKFRPIYMSDTVGLFGSFNRSASVMANDFFGALFVTSLIYTYVYTTSSSQLPQYRIYTSNDYNYTLDYRNNISTETLNGTSYTYTNTTATKQITNNLYLFKVNDTSVTTGASINLYSCSIELNGDIVRNLIPCYRKSDSVAGMYDLVNGVFYTNQGTGTFIVGADVSSLVITPCYKTVYVVGGSRLPSAYQEVEYLQSSGTQYITVTNFNPIPIADINIDTELMFKSSANMGICGDRFGTVDSTYGLFVYGNVRTDWVCKDSLTMPFTTNTKCRYQVSDTEIKKDGSVIVTGVASTRTKNVSYYPIMKFPSVGSISCFIGNFYYFKIYNGSNIVFDGIPCYRKSDSVAGMYDLVNGTFYTNSGTGTFIVGPDINALTTVTTIQSRFVH